MNLVIQYASTDVRLSRIVVRSADSHCLRLSIHIKCPQLNHYKLTSLVWCALYSGLPYHFPQLPNLLIALSLRWLLKNAKCWDWWNSKYIHHEGTSKNSVSAPAGKEGPLRQLEWRKSMPEAIFRSAHDEVYGGHDSSKANKQQFL